MKNLLFALIAILTFASASSAASAANLQQFLEWSEGHEIVADHSSWESILQHYVVTSAGDRISRLQYGKVSIPDRKRLKRYIADLSALDPKTFSKNEAFAYWANLYNALTVDLILEHYPIESIRDIKLSFLAFGPWKMKLVTVSGERLTLDDIEHGILRAGWDDPRVHYALNCASIGCPNLRVEAFTSNQLERQLDDAARDYINHPRGVRVDETGRLIVSSIYKWFREDFGDTDQDVINHFLVYADSPLANQLRSVRQISDYEYSWVLNDAR